MPRLSGRAFCPACLSSGSTPRASIAMPVATNGSGPSHEPFSLCWVSSQPLPRSMMWDTSRCNERSRVWEKSGDSATWAKGQIRSPHPWDTSKHHAMRRYRRRYRLHLGSMMILLRPASHDLEGLVHLLQRKSVGDDPAQASNHAPSGEWPAAWPGGQCETCIHAGLQCMSPPSNSKVS